MAQRASIITAVAARDSAAMRWLRIAADCRRAGLTSDARTAVRVSRLWPPPSLVDRRIPRSKP